MSNKLKGKMKNKLSQVSDLDVATVGQQWTVAVAERPGRNLSVDNSPQSVIESVRRCLLQCQKDSVQLSDLERWMQVRLCLRLYGCPNPWVALGADGPSHVMDEFQNPFWGWHVTCMSVFVMASRNRVVVHSCETEAAPLDTLSSPPHKSC